MNMVEKQLALVKILKKNPNCMSAKEELYECTYRFIYGLVLKMCKRQDLVDELANEAFMSLLLDAIPKYDLNSGVPFLGYANFWIVHAVKNYIMDNMTPIRMPKNVAQMYYRKISGSDEDFSSKKEHITKALAYSFVSTNTNIYNNLEIQDTLEDRKEDIDELILKDELRTIINNSKIIPREMKVLRDYYFNELTEKEKSVFEDCSKQRIGQIRKNALLKLRKSAQYIKDKEHNKQLIMEALYA